MGKSTAGDLLRQLGLPVADTDLIARQLVEPGQPALEEIRADFGPGFIGPDGRLDRPQLARLVFTDDSARARLERILHPRIRAVWEREAETWRAAGRTRGAVIIPLLYETNAAPLFDAVICVACSEASQRRRLAERGWDESEIRRRNAAQWPVEKKIDASDYVVWTDTTLEAHAAQLARIVGAQP